MAPAGRARHRGGRRGGRRARDAPSRPRARAGPGRAASLLQRGADRAGARRSARGQLWIYVAQTAIGLGVLVLFVRRPPERLAALRRPVLAGAAVAAAISRRDRRRGAAALRRRARAGQGRRPRHPGLGRLRGRRRQVAGDRRRLRGARRRACWCSACAASGRAGGCPARSSWSRSARSPTYAGPVVLDPLFNDFKRAAARRAARRRARARARGRRRRRRGLRDGRLAPHDRRQRLRHRPRAAPSGSCSTTRCIEDFEPAETRLVVAHELGHVHHHDVRNGLLWLALVAPFGMWARGRAGRAARRRAAPRSGRARCPPSRSRSRSSCRSSRSSPTSSRATSSARADAFSLELTRDPRDVHRASSGGSRSRTSPTPIRRARRALPARHPPEHDRADRAGGGVRAVKYTVLAVGRIRPPFADDVAALREAARAATRASSWSRCARTTQVERRIPPRATACCSTSAGATYDSLAFARWLEERRQGGPRRLLRGRRPVRDRARALRRAALVRPDDVPAPARARDAARAALPRAQDPRRRAVPSLSAMTPLDDLRTAVRGRRRRAAQRRRRRATG